MSEIKRNLPNAAYQAALLLSGVNTGDEVLDFANLAGFPGTGTVGKIYLAIDTNKIYSWTGAAYAEIAPGEPDSTYLIKGIARKSFLAEVIAGVNDDSYITPMDLEDKTYGTYTGTTISDNPLLKVALQELETALEAIVHSGNGIFDAANDGGTVPTAYDVIITDVLTLAGDLTINGAVTINDLQAAVDFIVKGDTDNRLLWVDGLADNIGIGTSPNATRKVDISNTDATKTYAGLNVYSTTAAYAIRGENPNNNGLAAIQGSGTAGGAAANVIGVWGEAFASGGLTKVGVLGRARNGANENYAIHGIATGTATSFRDAGVRGEMAASAVTSVGVFGEISAGGITGVPENVTGVYGWVRPGVTGVRAIGVHAFVNLTGAGTGNTGYSFFGQAGSAGTAGTMYGLVIQDALDFSGFGTILPTATMHVHGTARFSNLDTTPAQDHVLKSLDADGNADWGLLDADEISDAATTNKFVTAADITVLGNTTNTNSGDEVSATESAEGIAEIATQAEVNTGTDDTRFVTPAKLASYGDLNSKVSHNLIAFADGTPVAGGISVTTPNPAGTNGIVSCFEFKGSTAEGTPTSITIVLDANTASPTHTVEVYDITNAQSIGLVTGRAITGKSILTIGTLSNIPASVAIFELRVRKDAAGPLIVIFSSLSINY